MFEKISDKLLEFSYQKMRKRVNKCPRCQEMLEMPQHLPDAKYESTITCSHCGWLGTLADLGSHLLNPNAEIEESLIVKPKQSQIREVLGDKKASWLIPAKKKINFMMGFGGIWTVFTSLFIVLMLTQNVQTSGGSSGLWFAGLMLTLFFTIGLVIAYIGLRMSYTEILIRVDDEFVTLTRRFFNRMWDKRILRDKVKDVRLWEAYRQNEKPVYQVEIVDSDGAKHQFGSHLEHEEKRWLLTQIKSFLQVGDVAWRDVHGESEKKLTIDKLPSHSEISSKSLKIQKVGREGFRITRTYSMAPWLFFIGVVLSLGTSIWLFYAVSNFQWSGSDGWLGLVDLIFLFIPLLMPVVGFLIGVALIAGGFWMLGRRKIYEFTRDGLEETIEWRGTRKQNRYEKSTIKDVSIRQSGHINDEPRYKVVLLGGKKSMTLCNFEPEEVAEEVKRWVRSWL